MKQSASIGALQDLSLRTALHSELLLILSGMGTTDSAASAAQTHVDHDLVERYAFAQIHDDRQLRRIEEHLLICRPEDAAALHCEGGGSAAFHAAFVKQVASCGECRAIVRDPKSD